MQAGLELRELDAGEFVANLDACTIVYAAAMDPPRYQLPGRHSIMERHAGYAAFRAIAAVRSTGAGTTGAGTTGAGTTGAGTTGAGTTGAGTTGAGTTGAGRLIGFAYGFHGEGGRWWHDTVRHGLARARGGPAADHWLADSFEIAEVHVHPGHQGHGTGLAMMLRLAAGRPERTAVLSTMDAETRARRLYRGLGFTDLLEDFAFAGTEVPYAIMGAPLPLREASARPEWPERPSRW